MKNNLLRSSLALLALCTAASLSAASTAASSPRFATEIPLREVAARVPVNGDTVTAGTSRIMVWMRLGTPNGVLADGSWLYDNYNVRLSADGPEQPGTLVVRFAANQVTTLSVADKATVVALRAAPKHRASDQILAANDRR